MPKLPGANPLTNPVRRNLLRVGSIGLAGWSIPHSLASTPQQGTDRPKAKSCILLYMEGGPSHLDLLDLKPEAPKEIRGPYRPIDTSVPGVQISELFPHFARQLHRCTLVRSVCHDQTVHDPAVYQMLTGYRHVSTAGGLKVEADDVPHMAAAFQRALTVHGAMPPAIELPETMHMEGRILPGQNAGFLGASWDPLRVRLSPQGEVSQPEFQLRPDVTFDRLCRRSNLAAVLHEQARKRTESDFATGLNARIGNEVRYEAYRQQAFQILRSPQVGDAFSIDAEPRQTRETYGLHRHGQSVLLARRLVEAGARFVTVYWGRESQDWADGKGPRPANNPWDTHRNHFPLVQQSLMPRADQALAALLQDLAQRGLLDETLVVWMGDFGRTPRISQPWASRDHWPHAFSVILAGAGLPQGLLYGATDRHAAYVTENPVSPADLTATFFELLGIDPHTSLIGPGRMPHQLSTGTPIPELASSGSRKSA